MGLEVVGSKWLVEYDDSGWNTLAATQPKIMEELDGYEEATFTLKNTAANRAIVASDRTVRFSYDGEEIFRGTLAAVEYYSETLKCIVYNNTYETMKKRAIYNTYSTTSLPTLLGYICNSAGVAAGTCPAGTVSVRFENSLTYDSARFLALIAASNFWAEGGTFNIGVRNQCTLCLPLNEAAGTLITDVSGHGNSGTVNGASWISWGKYGYALDFDGDDYAELNGQLIPTDKFTFSVWVGDIGTAGAGDYGLFMGPDSGSGWFGYKKSDRHLYFGSPDGDFDSGYALPNDGEWHNHVATWDGTTLKVYSGGVLKGTVAMGSVVPSGNTFLGKNTDGNYINCGIDEPMIFNRAFTAEETQFLSDNSLGRVSVRKIDRSKRRDKILVKGIDAGGSTIWGSAGDGEDIAVFREKKAADETTLDLLAADKLAELDTDTNQLEIHLKPQHGALLRPGDLIPVVSTEMGVSGNYRIQRITKTPDEVVAEPERRAKTNDEILAELQSFEELGVIVDPELTPSDNAHWYNDDEQYTEETSYAKVKEIVLGAALNGTIRIKFDLKAIQSDPEQDAADVYAKIYRNGTALGTQRQTNSGDYVTYSEDLNTGWEAGGSMQIYAYGQDLIGVQRSTPYIQNMRICYDPDAYYSHTNNDP